MLVPNSFTVPGNAAFLSRAGQGVLVAGTAAAAAGAVAASVYLGPGAGAVAMGALIATQCAVADVTATKIRHPLGALAWNRFFGRGGHVPAVAAGLGASFVAVPELADIIGAFPGPLEAHREEVKLWLALFLGIEPWVIYDALKNPEHEGRRLQVLLQQTAFNAGGSALATLAEPIVSAAMSAFANNPIKHATAVQITTIAGYLAVLIGWGDVGREGLDDSEQRFNDERLSPSPI